MKQAIICQEERNATRREEKRREEFSLMSNEGNEGKRTKYEDIQTSTTMDQTLQNISRRQEALMEIIERQTQIDRGQVGRVEQYANRGTKRKHPNENGRTQSQVSTNRRNREGLRPFIGIGCRKEG